MNLLLLSNSTGADGNLRHALAPIAELAAGVDRAVFLPYAAVAHDWDSYAGQVADALQPLGIAVDGTHRTADPVGAVQRARLVIVGGGNTFALLHHCRRLRLLAPLRQRIRAGVPYLGWSAGANLACPTICTTNDMPVIDPLGLDALELVPWQINPHYTNVLPEGIRGETRNQRIAEFTRLRPDVPVIGLPEGNWLRIRPDAGPAMGGPHAGWCFSGEDAPLELAPGPLPASLLLPCALA